MKKVFLFMMLGCMVFAAGCSGCKKKDVNTLGEGQDVTGSEAYDFANEPSLRGDRDKNLNLKSVYFEFDRSDLSQDSLATLKENAAYLLNNKNIKVVLEGNCDQRGTVEYNLALGQRRAVKVKEYYVQLGVAANRIATISYGSEKPVDARNNESGWAKNRRVDTKEILQQ